MSEGGEGFTSEEVVADLDNRFSSEEGRQGTSPDKTPPLRTFVLTYEYGTGEERVRK